MCRKLFDLLADLIERKFVQPRKINAIRELLEFSSPLCNQISFKRGIAMDDSHVGGFWQYLQDIVHDSDVVERERNDSVVRKQSGEIDVTSFDRRDQQRGGGQMLRSMPLNKARRRTTQRYNEIERSAGKKHAQIFDNCGIIPGIVEARGLKGGFVQVDRIGECLTNCSRNSPEISLKGAKSRPNECNSSTRFGSAVTLLTAPRNAKSTPARTLARTLHVR